MAPPPKQAERPTKGAAVINDKRGEPRAPLALPSAVQRISPGDVPTSFLACTLDVSPTGARVALSFMPREAEHIQHLLRLPGENEPVVVNAQVVWATAEPHGGALVGISYDSLLPSVRRRIERVVDSRYDDVRRMSFLLALSSARADHSAELAGLAERMGLPSGSQTWEMREWTRHALSLFQHRKDLSARSPRSRTREL